MVTWSPRDGEMAQSVVSLLRSPKYLSTLFSVHVKSWTWWHICILPELERWRRDDSGSHTPEVPKGALSPSAFQLCLRSGVLSSRPPFPSLSTALTSHSPPPLQPWAHGSPVPSIQLLSRALLPRLFFSFKNNNNQKQKN